MPGAEQTWDYVVVGSGAGGATVAARLAEAGHSVLVLEAGGDPRAPGGDGARASADDYDVPAFHPFASENPAVGWRYFVEHYADANQAKADWKRGPDGVFYPRSGALGGCTAHNAGIFMRPHDSDWNGIAALTGEPSWRASRMERFWRKVEACRHRPLWGLLAAFGINPTGHGWNGWLPVERAMPIQALDDDELMRLLLCSVFVDFAHEADSLEDIDQLARGRLDPNDRRFLGREGVFYTPLTTRGHRRRGGRERLLEVRDRLKGRLAIETDALACRVLLDEHNRATGVAYLKGPGLYAATYAPAAAAGEARTVHARREVILAAGAFNTPQLLMLSGIGDPAELEAARVVPRVPLPGVGKNLQDRYEIGVVNRIKQSWPSLEGARFTRDDPLYAEWLTGNGLYVSNGAAIATIHRSRPELADPDVFAMAMIARFEGYFEGYSKWIAEQHDYLTWAILKGHTQNRAGTVTLASDDPRVRPRVQFNAFAEDPGGHDMAALVGAIRRVREMTAPLIETGVIVEETQPGPARQSDAELADYIAANAWGHHACGSAAIGPVDQGGVLDADFRVHGVKGLRVVDASAFPKIPGFFIAAPIYMLAEKAAHVIARDARRQTSR